MRLKSIRNQSKVSISVMLINLDSRPDRLIQSQIEADNFNFSFLRIPAVDISDIGQNQADFLSKPARACLKSHLKCYQELINSDFDFALVLEDDFKIKSGKKFKKVVTTPTWVDFDLIQLGFLYMDMWHRVDILLKLTKNFVFEKIQQFSNHGYTSRLQSKLEVKKRMLVPRGFIVDDLRAGSHAYLISRNMARQILDMSESVYLPIDSFLGTLQYTSSFKLIRSKRSLVQQRKSLSNIK